MRRINYDSATVDISVFFFGTKTHFISEWYFFKNHEIGSLVVRKVKTSWDSRQNRELGPAWESKSWLMTFSSWLSPGRVKKLQKFINFCLKVGHSATLKRLKSTWRQSSCDSPAGWNVQQQPHRVTGSIYDSCRFDIGRFRAKPTDLRKVSTSEWHTQSHTPTMVQGGGGGCWTPSSLEFLICCSISKKFCLQWKAFDLLDNMRYILWVVALLEIFDINKHGRHLGFYQELEG